ncbi:MAG: response regulator transcription factor [Dehalococcoidales bacterium]|nr:response regulator transcription factor [Dehalococcoidales bacterium]
MTKTRGSIRILLVDDHQVVRDGLQHMLEQEGDLKVIGQGANAEETLSQIENLSPDVVLMDIKMPGIDGIELTRQVKRRFPGCNIIMLTLYDQYLHQAMEAGASGYLLKDIKCNELARAIRQVHSGKIVTGESIRSKFRPDSTDGDFSRKDTGNPSKVEEIQLVLPPPVEANQLMRLSGRVEHVMKSRVLQVIGAWEEGTIMTIALNQAISFEEILLTLRNIPEIENAGEELPLSAVSTKLLEKAEAVPKLNNRIRKTIFVTLEKN